MNALDRLDNKSLRMRVVDLTIIVVQYPFGLIRKIRFMISRLRHNNNWIVSLATSLATMQVFRLLIVRLSNYDSSGISAVSEDESILLLVACYKRAPTQFAVELSLFLQFLLDCQESGACGFMDIFK